MGHPEPLTKVVCAFPVTMETTSQIQWPLTTHTVSILEARSQTGDPLELNQVWMGLAHSLFRG